MTDLQRIITLGQKHDIQRGQYRLNCFGIWLWDLGVKLGFFYDASFMETSTGRLWWWKKKAKAAGSERLYLWFVKRYCLKTLKAIALPMMEKSDGTYYWRSVERLWIDKGTYRGAWLSYRFGLIEWKSWTNGFS